MIKVSTKSFKNMFELLILKALKMSVLHKNYLFQVTGKILCVEFQGSLQIPHKISYQYIERNISFTMEILSSHS